MATQQKLGIWSEWYRWCNTCRTNYTTSSWQNIRSGLYFCDFHGAGACVKHRTGLLEALLLMRRQGIKS
jgi:hypothetical protein